MPDEERPNPEDEIEDAVERLRREVEAEGNDKEADFPPAPPVSPGERGAGGEGDQTLPSVPRIPLRKVQIDDQGLPLPQRRSVSSTKPTQPQSTPQPPRLPSRRELRQRAQASMPRLALATSRATPYPPPREATLHPPPSHPFRRFVSFALWSFALLLFAAALVVIAVAAYGVFRYVEIAGELPPTAADLYSQAAAQFQTTRIYDRNGRSLYEVIDPTAGRRTVVPIAKISPYLVAATIATEDRNFYVVPGFDPVAIVRAVVQNTREGETVSGASTITQQLVRSLLLTSEERAQRTYERKIREIVFAAEISRLYTKDEIMELYLNEIYYGNLAYGVQAASETYFKKPASDLSLAEAAMLAGLPQAPAVYDPYTNKEVVLQRMTSVLQLMIEASGDCAQPGAGIGVSNSSAPICVTPQLADAALAEIEAREFVAESAGIIYPHWVNYVRSLLEEIYGAQEVYRSGFNVYTTLDPALQDLAQQAVSDQVAALTAQNAKNGALVAIRPATGEILAMVGSPDFEDEEIDGQINMAASPRQPGSSIKPFTYLAAFEKGWTPATLIWDVPTDFPDGANPPYQPVNYDERFHGPVLVRAALANSYNVPAVKALQFVGVYDDPNTPEKDGLIAFAERLGITTLTRDDYGLALTLGGGEVTLLEHTAAYATLADNGIRLAPIAILKITDSGGETRCEQPLLTNYQLPITDLQPPGGASQSPISTCQPLPPNWGQQVIRPAHATLITSILSDNASRTPAFGSDSPLNTSFPAAAKTGTTNDFRDNWTMGYTTALAVGVWVGNADYTEMIHSTGITGAAPIWRQFMDATQGIAGYEAGPFVRASDVVERVICAPTGAEPGVWCEGRPQRTELFAYDQPPLPADRDVIHKFYLDKFTGLRANSFCQDRTEEKDFVDIADPFAIKWLETSAAGQQVALAWGIELPVKTPPPECADDTPRPILSIVWPQINATVSGRIQIYGEADVTKDFDRYVVEWGLGADPQGWGNVAGPIFTPVRNNGLLAEWDTASLNEPVTIRLVVFDKAGHSADLRLYLNPSNPTATPAPTQTPPPTDTPLPTSTPEPPTATPLPSATPEPPTATTEPPTDTPTTSPG